MSCITTTSSFLTAETKTGGQSECFHLISLFEDTAFTSAINQEVFVKISFRTAFGLRYEEEGGYVMKDCLYRQYVYQC